MKLVISDSHEGIKAAVAKVLKATWQRCRVHFMRNALAHAGKTQRRMVSAAIGTVFVQDSADAARTQWRSVADQLRDKFPKLGALMDDAENDVLAFMTFPRAHWTQIYSTNPLERLNAEITGSQVGTPRFGVAVLKPSSRTTIQPPPYTLTFVCGRGFAVVFQPVTILYRAGACRGTLSCHRIWRSELLRRSTW